MWVKCILFRVYKATFISAILFYFLSDDQISVWRPQMCLFFYIWLTNIIYVMIARISRKRFSCYMKAWRVLWKLLGDNFLVKSPATLSDRQVPIAAAAVAAARLLNSAIVYGYAMWQCTLHRRRHFLADRFPVNMPIRRSINTSRRITIIVIIMIIILCGHNHHAA